MSTSAQSEALENAGRFYGMLKSLHEFDKAEVLGVINTLLAGARAGLGSDVSHKLFP